jgi:putative oxidoreductase
MVASSSPAAARLSDLAPLILRVVLGGLMIAHGYLKLIGGPANFGRMLAGLGVPAPMFLGYLVTYTELVGGALLVVGLLSRLVALALTADLVVALALVKVNIGLIAPHGMENGAELCLAYISGFVFILFAGPGRFSLDRLIGIDRPPPGAVTAAEPIAAARR